MVVTKGAGGWSPWTVTSSGGGGGGAGAEVAAEAEAEAEAGAGTGARAGAGAGTGTGTGAVKRISVRIVALMGLPSRVAGAKWKFEAARVAAVVNGSWPSTTRADRMVPSALTVSSSRTT